MNVAGTANVFIDDCLKKPEDTKVKQIRVLEGDIDWLEEEREILKSRIDEEEYSQKRLCPVCLADLSEITGGSVDAKIKTLEESIELAKDGQQLVFRKVKKRKVREKKKTINALKANEIICEAKSQICLLHCSFANEKLVKACPRAPGRVYDRVKAYKEELEKALVDGDSYYYKTFLKNRSSLPNVVNFDEYMVR